VQILVVDDDPSYREALSTVLAREGYEVFAAANGAEGLERFTEDLPDLVLLDMLMPGIPGTEVCRRMRAIAPVPVVMVSAVDGEVDVVLALELGAADYITKPFHLRELVARVQAVLRRAVPLDAPEERREASVARRPGGSKDVPDDVVVAGPVRLDRARRTVEVRGEHVQLSRREFDLLAYLLTPPGQVRTREEIIDALWANRDLSDTRTLDTHIRRLRTKVEPNGERPGCLVTVRGVGFRFDPD
jgi:two-component system response regulator RegX3